MERFNALSRNGKIGAGCGGLIVLWLLCGLCFQMLPGNDQPEPTPTPEPTAAVQPLLGSDDEATAEPEATETIEPTETEEPTATNEPTVEPTAVPPTEAPTAVPSPTAIPQPTEPPPPPAPPTEPPVPRPDLDPTAKYNCSDFSSHNEAQGWWNYWRELGHNNPGGLDGDGDGDVCESMR